MEKTGALTDWFRCRKLTKRAIPAAAIGFMAGAPALAGAQVTTACDIVSRVSSLIGVFGTILLIVALAMILYAAALFMVGGTNEETLKKARIVLILALVGLAVAFLATLADDIVIQLLNAGNLETTCPKPPGL